MVRPDEQIRLMDAAGKRVGSSCSVSAGASAGPIRHGTLSPARYRALSDASHRPKTIGKPCAGNRHARF